MEPTNYSLLHRQQAAVAASGMTDAQQDALRTKLADGGAAWQMDGGMLIIRQRGNETQVDANGYAITTGTRR